MSPPPWMAWCVNDDYHAAILDYYTHISLEAYWRQIVKESCEINYTGQTYKDNETSTNNLLS